MPYVTVRCLLVQYNVVNEKVTREVALEIDGVKLKTTASELELTICTVKRTCSRPDLGLTNGSAFSSGKL